MIVLLLCTNSHPWISMVKLCFDSVVHVCLIGHRGDEMNGVSPLTLPLTRKKVKR